jgi:guanine nucleotide-exchange factor
MCVQVMVSVVECMLQKLLMLSIDPRPELRNCAMNTLFTVTCAHASFMTVALWRDVFTKVIFPLFDRAKEKSRIGELVRV